MGGKKIKIKLEYIPILLFIISCLFYLNINSLPYTNPGNIKAADPFYHVINVEGILDTNQWNYVSPFIALGEEKMLNQQPPLYYLNAAILTTFSNVPAWATMYFIVCISQAFIVLLTYLMAKEAFNKEIGAIAAAFAVLPMLLDAWLYQVYIGLWIQVAAYMFVMLFFWLFLRYFKKKEDWTLVFMGLSISSIILLHPQDLGFLFFPGILLVIEILRNKQWLKKGLILGGLPALAAFSMAERFLFVWSRMGSSQYVFGLFKPHYWYVTRDYLQGLVFPDIFFLPVVVLVLFAAGILQQAINWKKYKRWLFLNTVYFGIVYLSIFLVKNPHYFQRARSLTPYFVFPTAAYIVYTAYLQIKKMLNQKFPDIAFIAIISILVIALSIPGYIQLRNRMSGEILTEGRWEAMEWIHENSPVGAKVLFFGTVSQSENIYAKRITAEFNPNEYNRILQEFQATNITPRRFRGSWGGVTLRGAGVIESEGLFNYQLFTEPEEEIYLEDFDYVVFFNLNNDFRNINYFFASRYITELGYIPAFENTEAIIIRK